MIFELDNVELSYGDKQILYGVYIKSENFKNLKFMTVICVIMTSLMWSSDDYYLRICPHFYLPLRHNDPNIDLINSNERVSGILESPELGLTLSDELVTDVWPKVSQTKKEGKITLKYCWVISYL